MPHFVSKINMAMITLTEMWALFFSLNLKVVNSMKNSQWYKKLIE